MAEENDKPSIIGKGNRTTNGILNYFVIYSAS